MIAIIKNNADVTTKSNAMKKSAVVASAIDIAMTIIKSAANLVETPRRGISTLRTVPPASVSPSR